jgi:hypothetical protein
VPEQSKLPVSILIDGRRARSLTRATSIGPYVLVLDTVLPDQALELHSIYVGHKHTTTQATHLRLARGDLRETVAIEHEHDSIPVMYARRRALYDHLQNLQDLLEEAGIEATIPIDEKAIVAVED